MDVDKGKKIEITDKLLFDAYFQEYSAHISEFTFTNLFIWRDYYDILFIEYHNNSKFNLNS